MKKKMLYLFLTIVSVVSLIGCGNSESSKEASEAVSATQGNALESAFLSEDHFELREESITIEYGTPLSDDISEYVIAKDYSIITYEYEESSPSAALRDGTPGKVTFTRYTGENLVMTVNYTDTTLPTIEQTEYTYYTLSANGLLDIFEELAPEKRWKDGDSWGEGTWYLCFVPNNFYEWYGMDDNSFCELTALSIDGINYELDEVYPWYETNILPLSYGSHKIEFEICDGGGNVQTFECTFNVVADIEPERREWLISEKGYSEEKIDAAIEEFISQ